MMVYPTDETDLPASRFGQVACTLKAGITYHFVALILGESQG